MSTIAGVVHHALHQVAEAGRAVVDGILDRDPHPTIEGQDGFVSYNPASGEVLNQYHGGAIVHQQSSSHPEFGPLQTLLEHSYPGQRVTFEVGGQVLTPASQTDDKGIEAVPGSLLPGALKQLDPATGGLITVAVSTPGIGQASARLLALPADYDGPIFISDIDDTLRSTRARDLVSGHTQAPIEGIPGLLSAMAAKRVPIIYLSAGSVRLHSDNEAFLQQLPDGVLFDRDLTGRHFLSPHNAEQAKVQGDYKAHVIAALQQAYPRAHFFGIGDDKYGDAQAYTETGVTAYIRNVDPTQRNVPGAFNGVITDSYTPEFQARVESDVQNVIDRSRSFGGHPDSPVSPPAPWSNPAPLQGKT